MRNRQHTVFVRQPSPYVTFPFPLLNQKWVEQYLFHQACIRIKWKVSEGFRVVLGTCLAPFPKLTVMKTTSSGGLTHDPKSDSRFSYYPAGGLKSDRTLTQQFERANLFLHLWGGWKWMDNHLYFMWSYYTPAGLCVTASSDHHPSHFCRRVQVF